MSAADFRLYPIQRLAQDTLTTPTFIVDIIQNQISLNEYQLQEGEDKSSAADTHKITPFEKNGLMIHFSSNDVVEI